MNYIKRLERENAHMSNVIRALDDEIRRLRGELLTPKFVGYDEDGDRRDWMATSDIDTRLQGLQSLVQ